MITADKIASSEQKNDTTKNPVVILQIQESVAMEISRHEDTPETRKRVDAILRQRLWRRIYGELADELAELEAVFLRDARDPRRAEDLVARVRAAMQPFGDQSF